MMQVTDTRHTERMVSLIQELDLEPIKFKLMDRAEGQGWRRDYVERMALEYKRFLTLLARYPNEPVAPAKDVDKFWHAHILDTQKYIEDCERIFGYYLHHFPYFGMRGAEDAAALKSAGQRTRELYEAEFGEAPEREASAFCSIASEVNAAFCSSSQPAFCSAASETNAAFCSASQRAFCSASRAGIDTRTRPTLAPMS